MGRLSRSDASGVADENVDVDENEIDLGHFSPSCSDNILSMRNNMLSSRFSISRTF